ncbi:MAG: hypothetical protein BGO34_12145 [Bacteroidia bacterium 44-10]|nr:MAG: hypothetical protein BGO34_12145 [Bacteroidia bacterium 44-10]
MPNIHQSPVIPNYFAEQINLAYKVINCSSTIILQMFKDKEICIMNYRYKESNDKVIEIGVDTVTLTCLFDENNICNWSFLSLDDSNNLRPHIDYCNKAYEYSYLLGGWLIENYCLRIKPDKDGYFFALQPV